MLRLLWHRWVLRHEQRLVSFKLTPEYERVYCSCGMEWDTV